ncbi:hypothetical protein L596_014065 [Steinernema carpocapsae]|uniref:Uncharacterized protein n=1 Tax=Steinernema carpocapsae TaxID=34508 RepID=A0A4V6A2P0_STECR|nr:hypothetical protein L596_014065 [Steinernema carpocapsae]
MRLDVCLFLLFFALLLSAGNSFPADLAEISDNALDSERKLIRSKRFFGDGWGWRPWWTPWRPWGWGGGWGYRPWRCCGFGGFWG